MKLQNHTLELAIIKKYNPIKMGKKVANSIVELADYMEEFPSDLKNAIRKINSGQVKVDLTHKGIDPMVHTLQRITKQLITTFIMVALIIGASLFIVFEIHPLLEEYICIRDFKFYYSSNFRVWNVLKNINKGDYDY